MRSVDKHKTGGVIDSVEEFDPATNTWTTRLSGCRIRESIRLLPSWTTRSISWAGTNEGIISTVDVYDPSLDTWTTEASLPTARRLLGAAVVDNTIYAIGGDALVARVGEQFIYQITATNNPTRYDTSPLPAGLSVDNDRGIISGIPTDATQGFVVTLKATNATAPISKTSAFT